MAKWRVHHAVPISGYGRDGARLAVQPYQVIGRDTQDLWYDMARCEYNFGEGNEAAIRVPGADARDGSDLFIRIAEYAPHLRDFPANVIGEPAPLLADKRHVTVLPLGGHRRDTHELETAALNAIGSIPGTVDVEIEASTQESVSLSFLWNGNEDFQGTDEHLARFGLRKHWLQRN